MILNKRYQSTGTTAENALCHYSIFKSPIGDLLLVAEASALAGLYFTGCDHVPAVSRSWTHTPDHPVLRGATQQLEEYFAGRRESFSLPLRLAGTAFQKRIWNEIALIPYGETVTYAELAHRAGAPRAIRAAGTSTGRNPVSIIIPCHRVVGKNGRICGFAGGLERKRLLLELEDSARPAKGSNVSRSATVPVAAM